mgnify:CR=1 FL=1
MSSIIKNIPYLLFGLGALGSFQACTTTKKATHQTKKQVKSTANFYNVPVVPDAIPPPPESQKIYDPTYFLREDDYLTEPTKPDFTAPKQALQVIQNYREAAQQLKNLLDQSSPKLDSLEKHYVSLTQLKTTSRDEDQKQIKALNSELAKLKGESFLRSLELSQARKAHQNALFALNIEATPGRIRRERFFSPAIRAHHVARVKLDLYFTRVFNQQDRVTFRLIDAANNEIPLEAIQGSFNQPRLQVMLIPKADQQVFFKGKYIVYVILNNSKEHIQNQTIGLTEFTLR